MLPEGMHRVQLAKDGPQRANLVARLKSRHIQFIALGGTIGTGLFLGIGGAFTTSGPLSVLLGYTFTGIAVFAMMQCLGEMATWLPLPGSIPQFCARYCDDAMGFAVGWNVSGIFVDSRVLPRHRIFLNQSNGSH